MFLRTARDNVKLISEGFKSILFRQNSIKTSHSFLQHFRPRAAETCNERSCPLKRIRL